MKDTEKDPLPQVPVVLLCAEDDDLELVSFVHQARKYGLEPEVVPGVEVTDDPLVDAMTQNEAALFVVLRSDNLSAERTLALKRAFNRTQKPQQHLLALRLEPERAQTSVRTIARRLRQLMGPKVARAAPQVRPPPAPARVEPEVDEWAGTLIVDKRRGPVQGPPSPSDASPPHEPPAKPPEHTWTGTLIADDVDAAPLHDGEATPLPGAHQMPPPPSSPALAGESRRSEAQWGGTLIADPSIDGDITLPRDVSSENTISSSDSSSWYPAPKRRTNVGLLAALGLLVAAGGIATTIASRGDGSVSKAEPTASAVSEPRDAPSPDSPPATPPKPAERKKTTKRSATPTEPSTPSKQAKSSPARANAEMTEAPEEHALAAEPAPVENPDEPRDASVASAPREASQTSGRPLPSLADDDSDEEAAPPNESAAPPSDDPDEP